MKFNGNGHFHEIQWKSWFYCKITWFRIVFYQNSEKCWNLMPSKPCVGNGFLAHLLGLPRLCDFTPRSAILGEMCGFPPNIGEIWWFPLKWGLLGRKWCFGGPGAQTPTKPMGFIGCFGGRSLVFCELHLKLCFCLNFTWKSWFPIFAREKTRKPWNRTPGWTSRKAAKALV